MVPNPGTGGPAAIFTPPRRAALSPDQPQDDQEDHRADKRVDDGGDKARADIDAELRQQPPGDDRADNADHDVAQQPIAAAFDHHSGKPAGDGSDDQPNDNALDAHRSPQRARATTGRTLRLSSRSVSAGARAGTVMHPSNYCTAISTAAD